jgi:hypothetical protein
VSLLFCKNLAKQKVIVSSQRKRERERERENLSPSGKGQAKHAVKSTGHCNFHGGYNCNV